MRQRVVSSVVLVVALSAVACSGRCARAPAKPHTKRQTDLRSTLLIIYPEYRGTRVSTGHATLTRWASGVSVSRATETLERNGFRAEAGRWVRPPFTAYVSENAAWPGVTTLQLELPLKQDTVERLFMTPAAMSTLDLGMWWPRDPNAFIEKEQFELFLGYDAQPPGRGAFLTQQLVRLLLGSGQWEATKPLPADWAVDGGALERFEATLQDRSSRALVNVFREGDGVTVSYTLVTDEP